MAWAELGRLMEHVDAATVGDLRHDAVVERAEKLWIVPPGFNEGQEGRQETLNGTLGGVIPRSPTSR